MGAKALVMEDRGGVRQFYPWPRPRWRDFPFSLSQVYFQEWRTVFTSRRRTLRHHFGTKLQEGVSSLLPKSSEKQTSPAREDVRFLQANTDNVMCSRWRRNNVYNPSLLAKASIASRLPGINWNLLVFIIEGLVRQALIANIFPEDEQPFSVLIFSSSWTKQKQPLNITTNLTSDSSPEATVINPFLVFGSVSQLPGWTVTSNHWSLRCTTSSHHLRRSTANGIEGKCHRHHVIGDGQLETFSRNLQSVYKAPVK